MPDDLQRGHVVNPVTAAASTAIGQKVLLLIGEGCCLKVFDDDSNALLGSWQVFPSQAIHGIDSSNIVNSSSATCLVWGGRHITVVNLILSGSGLSFTSTTKALVVDDWISDACLLSDIERTGVGDFLPQAILLSSHNVLSCLLFDRPLKSGTIPDLFSIVLAAGPALVLYSAHIAVLDTGQVLVAAGTAFGEVIVWSYNLRSLRVDHCNFPTMSLLHSFLGHEGSVFGVTISKAVFASDDGQLYRIVASCSDDRTIRVWAVPNVSAARLEVRATATNTFKGIDEFKGIDTGFGSERTLTRREEPWGCLAMAMGHMSRIWGLIILSDSADLPRLLSYGEDATCQTWQLSKRLPVKGSELKDQPYSYALEHIETFERHTGKNIWAATAIQKVRGTYSILTGGADGRIVSYDLPTIDRISGHIHSRGWIVGPSSIRLSKSKKTSSTPQAKQAFCGIEGSWTVRRILDSTVYTYPSSVFNGTATLTQRVPTNEAYDIEYLYVEEGELTTTESLIIRATRRYVYRYQETNESITAWFVKTDDHTKVDYLFHQVRFCDIAPSSFRDGSTETLASSTAKGHHLCGQDNYFADYEFQYRAKSLQRWNVKYTVRGPRKDYTTAATYVRLDSSEMTVEKQLMITARPEFCDTTEECLDSFKMYCWIGPEEFVSTTAQGRILLGFLKHGAIAENYSESLSGSASSKSIRWSLIDQLRELESYSLTAFLTNDTVLMGTASGLIYRYRRSTQSVKSFLRLPRKVSGLFTEELRQPADAIPQRTAIIACCLGDPSAYYFNVDTGGNDSGKTTKPIKLTLPPTFTVTSICFTTYEHLLVLGSRGGALCFYDYTLFDSITAISASYCIRHIHGEDAVTVIRNVPKNNAENQGTFLLTAGRDGNFAVHRLWINKEQKTVAISLETVHTAKPPFGPNIEGALFDSTSRDLLLWGFRSKDFVVWNETKKTEVMKVACGGCHRSWSYLPSDDGVDGGTFIWTKASTCHVQAQDRCSHRVLQSGGHGREIKAIAICPVQVMLDNNSRYLIATGSEDTSISIYVDTGLGAQSSSTLRCLGIMSKHITGIQQLKWSSNGRYLFSAGGMEEVYAWRVQQVPCIGVGFVCVSKCPTVTESSDLRVMNFHVATISSKGPDALLVSIVYSDSTIRSFLFDANLSTEGFSIYAKGTYRDCCLTQIQYLSVGGKTFLLTASTDGHITFWPSDGIEQRHDVHGVEYLLVQTSKGQEHEIHWSQRHRIHKSSIKCLSLLYISREEVIVATGGDDNAIAFTSVTLVTGSSSSLSCSTLLIPKAHASAVTGIQCLDLPKADESHERIVSYRFVSISNDQRLKYWILTVRQDKAEAERLSVSRKANRYSSIGDASCIELTPRGWPKRTAIIAGIGLEAWNIEDD